MDNPEDLVRTLEGQVERLKVIFNEATSALTDDVSEVSQFCVSLECCLRHHQREKLSFWGERRDYWNYLNESVGRMKTLETIVKKVQTLSHLTTSQGRGRGLIRGCLEEHMLADLVQKALSNTKRTKEWYHSTSVLLSPAHSQRLISALYDLSAVDFDLPAEGVDLDETWPSFVLKSFQSSDMRRSLFGSLSPRKEAIAVSKKSQLLLEQGVEEEASEIYVKQEIPFSIDLVGSLLDDIRCNLVGQSETIGGQTHLCPELDVTKLDDITSCLTILRDYITSWSRDVTKNSHTLQEEVRRATEQLADVEMQLQETMKESEGVETSLLNQLQDTRDDLQVCSEQIQQLIDDNLSLKNYLSDRRSKISELEGLNFSLEEQLMEVQGEEGEEVDGGECEGGGGRGRSATLIEAALQERDEDIGQLSAQLAEREHQLQQMRAELTSTHHALHTLSPLPALLQQQVVAETEAKAAVYFNCLHMQNEYSDLEHRHRQCVSELDELKRRGQEAELREVCKKLGAENSRLSREVDDLRTQLAVAAEEKRREEREKAESLEKEVEKLSGECSVVKDEATALRYQLSSVTMEQQQLQELLAEKERSLTSLYSKLSDQEKLLRDSRQKYQQSQAELEELRRETREMESALGAHAAEVALLNEQLTEKTHSRDKERAELLKAHNSIDSIQAQLETEKQEYAKEVARLTEDNTEIRRAFRRLLQQKVTLWQHADELEQEQQQMGMWINSKNVMACMECGSNFSLLTRKHHCRSCGRVCCNKCCDRKAQLPFSKEPVRVCDRCHQKIGQMRTPFVSKFINSDLESQDSPPATWRKSSNSLNIERSIETAGNSLQAKLRVQNDDSSVSSSLDGRWAGWNGEAVEGEGGGGATRSLEWSGQLGTSPTNIVRPQSSSSEVKGEWSLHDEYSVDPETKRRESARSSSCQSRQADRKEGVAEEVQYHIAAVEGDSLEESYYLIDTQPQFPVGLDVVGNKLLDVNALASKLATLEVNREQQTTGEAAASDPSPVHVATGGENLRGSPTGFVEISLEGGKAHVVTVKVEKKGTTIAWEFMSEPKGLAFGLSFEGDGEGATNEQILPLRRCMSHKAALSGEYVSQKAGNYLLRFDNCHSKYSGRKLKYRHWIKPPS